MLYYFYFLYGPDCLSIFYLFGNNKYTHKNRERAKEGRGVFRGIKLEGNKELPITDITAGPEIYIVIDNSPHDHLITTLIISGRRDTRGKWPLARNPDSTWWHRHTSLKLFFGRSP